MELVGYYGNPMFNFLINCQNCLPKKLHHFKFPLIYEDSNFTTLSPTLLVCDCNSSYSSVVLSGIPLSTFSLMMSNISHVYWWNFILYRMRNNAHCLEG